jgi:hypothetical protein
MERFFHLYAREHPRHFCVVAEISGDIDALDFQTAFDRVQRRHPMLSAYIAVDVRSGPSIFHSDRKLPVGVVASTEPGDWHAIVERELRTPFVDSEAPLLRATVLRARRQATIVLTLHHALLDGLSAAVIVGDLLEALNGHELKPLPALSSLEQLLEKALLPHGETIQMRAPAGVDADKLRAIARMPLWRPFEGDRPMVSTVSFSAAETERIRRRCRDESTTVQGAFCAALVRTAAKPPNEAFTITSPVNARGVLGNVDAHAGFLFSLATVNLSAPFDRPLWDIARKVTDDMADARTNDGVLRFVAAVEAAVPPDADTELACGAMGALAYDAIVTNLGALPLPAEIGALRLDAFWGPSVQGRFRNEIVIGAATLGKQLRVIQTSPDHIEPLLESLRADLLDACRDGQ